MMEKYKEILATDLPDVDKVAELFKHVTDLMVEQSEQQVEVLRAMGDREALIKEQIKLSTVKSVRGILNGAYRQVTGRKVWNE